ncbi:alpha/beta fold hydrolase [Microbacterium oleivorans]|uniref:Alpha/beta hydrolase n=1 Tax=Microbacterium oleivorans TaxID=273677 RepID=A0A7D5FAD8_9MICO|nr:alpha/beta hydrolase [Microbacterium oleivorans]QLD12629.1 alpha/beta hydrolase [Microbacterium oleivorans]
MAETPFDEFSFLPVQAAESGVPVPSAERLFTFAPDGRPLSALRLGDGLPEVTLLHGAGLNAHTWDRTALALGRPVLALDLPGHGDSGWRDDADYAARTLAADIAPAIAHWTETPQVVVGQSLGGLTAAALAAAHPELVRALVIVDIAPGLDPAGGASQIRRFFAGPTHWASREEMVDRALSFGLGGDRTAAERGVYLNSRVREDGRVEWKHHFARIANVLAADPGASAAASARQDSLAGILAASGWEDLAAVSAPVTLVRGNRGYLSDADVEAFTTRLPDAGIVTVDSGHNVQEELPSELARIIRDAGLTSL